jgi:hypothetical protein
MSGNSGAAWSGTWRTTPIRRTLPRIDTFPNLELPPGHLGTTGRTVPVPTGCPLVEERPPFVTAAGALRPYEPLAGVPGRLVRDIPATDYVAYVGRHGVTTWNSPSPPHGSQAYSPPLGSTA